MFENEIRLLLFLVFYDFNHELWWSGGTVDHSDIMCTCLGWVALEWGKSKVDRRWKCGIMIIVVSDLGA